MAETTDTQNLAMIVTQWRSMSDELTLLKQQVAEKAKRVKVLEGLIMSAMKKDNLGALDLKSSGGRILYEKKDGKSGLSAKVLQKLLTEHLKDETKASEALKYIAEHREVVNKEKISSEKNV